MENKRNEIVKRNPSGSEGKKISRKDAIKKVGYIAASAATMMVLLSNPNKAHAASPAPPPKSDPPKGGGGHSGPWH